MDSTTIALDREAYELLRGQKKKGESFSDTVKRVFRPKRHLADFAGIWSGAPREDLAAIRHAVAEGRRLDLDRVDRLLKRMG